MQSSNCFLSPLWYSTPTCINVCSSWYSIPTYKCLLCHIDRVPRNHLAMAYKWKPSSWSNRDVGWQLVTSANKLISSANFTCRKYCYAWVKNIAREILHGHQMHRQASVHEQTNIIDSKSQINLKLFHALHSQGQETNRRPRNVLIILRFAKQNTTAAAAATQPTVTMSKQM